jgi:hypothetical protein
VRGGEEVVSELYTTSRLRTWRDCPRKHGFRYELGVLTPSTPAMSFGTDGHGVLEAWYRAWMAGCAACDGSGEKPFADTTHGSAPECAACGGSGFNGADRIAAAFAAIDGADLSDLDRAKLRVLAAAYDARWGGEPWEVIAVEAEFRYWLGDVEMGGKLDALVRHVETGAVYVVEHKFTSADFSPGSPYWAKLELDTQISVYHDGAATAFDVEIAGCVYDVLKRPQHELRLATPPEARKYTLGKGCAKCGGSAGGKKGIVQGRGFYTVSMVFAARSIKVRRLRGHGLEARRRRPAAGAAALQEPAHRGRDNRGVPGATPPRSPIASTTSSRAP